MTPALIEKSVNLTVRISSFFLSDIKNTIHLAILADELLKIEGVEVSFTIGKTYDNKVHISTRSMGNISADLIMKKLGGGGHVTDAAAEFKNKTNKEVIELLNTVLEE